MLYPSWWVISRGSFIMLICLIPGDIYLDHLVKMVFAGSLHCNVTLFPFVVSSWVPWETYLRLYNSFSPQTFWLIFPNLVSITISSLQKSWVFCLIMMFLYFPHSFCMYSLEFYCKKDLLFLPHSFFNLIICL